MGPTRKSSGWSEQSVSRFASNEIISLVGQAPRFDLAESTGPGLRLAELAAPSRLPEHDLLLDYATASGDPRLRKAIADLHDVDADDVITTVGAMHALFLLAFTLCERGDEAIFNEPGFPLARNALIAVGATLRALSFAFDRAYRPDLALFRDLLSEKTRLVSLASPQNPSGVAIALRTLDEMARLMQERAPHAWLLVDETYREASYAPDRATASAATLGPKVITIASLSKCHGAPGLRIGWIIVRDRALREQLTTAKFNTVICCSRVDEALALQVLDQRDRLMVSRSADLGGKRTIAAHWVGSNERFVEWVQPDAGAMCCVRLRCARFDDAGVERFYSTLAEQGVRVAPGDWFGEERRIFRLGFGLLNPSELQAALARLSAALERSAGPAPTSRKEKM
jgi:aspartate/methionine/tyrosine aminotransferase